MGLSRPSCSRTSVCSNEDVERGEKGNFEMGKDTRFAQHKGDADLFAATCVCDIPNKLNLCCGAF